MSSCSASAQIATALDRTRAIVEAGLDPGSGSARCTEVLELFAGILGAEAGNMALTVLATWGSTWPAASPGHPSGPARRPFLSRLHGKGRMSPVVAAMPVAAAAGFGRSERAWLPKSYGQGDPPGVVALQRTKPSGGPNLAAKAPRV
jgi:glucokinase